LFGEKKTKKEQKGFSFLADKQKDLPPSEIPLGLLKGKFIVYT